MRLFAPSFPYFSSNRLRKTRKAIAGSVVVPDLTDKALRESYGADSGEAALQEMLYPGEYMRLLEAVKDINGFQSRRRVWKEQAKK